MKKLLAGIALAFAASLVFAASYKNNTYQKLADEYTRKAQHALDAGEYVLAEEYAAKAEENARLSEEFVKKMLAKSDCDTVMKQAARKLEYAKSINAERNFPMAYSSAQKSFASAQQSYNDEDYTSATAFAKQVLEALADIKEITPLPEYYVVRPWAETKDCYWNISGRPYVYDNPLLWENLYQANKSNMPRPNDPNLILPGMKMKIPSITGEYREGVYNPSKKYDPYSANR
ncbi:LysM peptidoglycan-binding domain-containing protein [Treponema sp.]|uniref:LysM peptidoglycan-binding domain-containing protein n=1 Tax=Treponema sp. TaxID=166 RepID=UPI00388DB6FE